MCVFSKNSESLKLLDLVGPVKTCTRTTNFVVLCSAKSRASPSVRHSTNPRYIQGSTSNIGNGAKLSSNFSAARSVSHRDVSNAKPNVNTNMTYKQL